MMAACRRRGTVSWQNVISRGHYLLLAVYGMDVARKRPMMTRVQLGIIFSFQDRPMPWANVAHTCPQFPKCKEHLKGRRFTGDDEVKAAVCKWCRDQSVFYFVTVCGTALKYWIRVSSSSYIRDSFSNFSYMLDTATSFVESFFLLVRGHRLADTLDKFATEMSRLDKGDRHPFIVSRRLFLMGVASGLTQLILMTSTIWLKPKGSIESFASSYLWQTNSLPRHQRAYSIVQDTYDISYIVFIDMFFCTFLNYFIFCAYIAYKTFQAFNESVVRRYARRVRQLSEEVALVMQAHKKLSDLVSEMNEVTSTLVFAVVCLTSVKICVSVRANAGVSSIWEAIDIASIFFSALHLLGFFLASAMLNAEAHKIPDILVACSQTGMPAYNEKVFVSSTLLWEQISANPIGLKASRYILLSYEFISLTFGTLITYSVILYEMAK